MDNYPAKLANALVEAHNRLGTWAEVTRVFFNNQIPVGTLSRIANSGGAYMPTENKNHLRLLCVYIQKPKTVWQMTKEELLQALENRVALNTKTPA